MLVISKVNRNSCVWQGFIKCGVIRLGIDFTRQELETCPWDQLGEGLC